MNITEAVKRTLWHIKSVHQSEKRFEQLRLVVKGIPKLNMGQDIEKCLACMPANVRKLARRKSEKIIVDAPFQGIHMDPGFLCKRSKDETRVDQLHRRRQNPLQLCFSPLNSFR